jgi:hypothetical protein
MDKNALVLLCHDDRKYEYKQIIHPPLLKALIVRTLIWVSRESRSPFLRTSGSAFQFALRVQVSPNIAQQTLSWSQHLPK